MTKQPTLNSVRRQKSVRVSKGLSRFAGVAALGLAVALGGCAGVMGTKGPADKPGMAGKLPAGAIQVGDDRYMAPVDKDSSGCQRYTPWSAKHPVTTAIYYRKSDGSFTLNPAEAACTAG